MQKMSNRALEGTRNVEAARAADIPKTLCFAKPADEVQMRSKVGVRMNHEPYQDISWAPGFEHFISAFAKNSTKHRQPEVKQAMVQDHELLSSRKDFLDEAILIGQYQYAICHVL